MSDQNNIVDSSVQLAELLDALGPNAVIYSEDAWAVARKSSSGGIDGRWFPDHGSHASRAMNSAALVAWAKDWTILRDGSTE